MIHYCRIIQLVFISLCLMSAPLFSQDYQPGVLMVKFRPETSQDDVQTRQKRLQNNQSQFDAINKKWGAVPSEIFIAKSQFNANRSTATPQFDTPLTVLRFPETIDVSRIIYDYQNLPFIESVEYNYYLYISEQDIIISDQSYHLWHDSLKNAPFIDHDRSTIVGVVDTGIDHTHPNLIHSIYTNSDEIPNNRIDDDGNGYIDDVNGISFLGYALGISPNLNIADLHGHGTHISGIIAAKPNSHDGIWGINPSAKVLPIKFMDQDGKGTQLDAAVSILYAVEQGAKVINCSWGYFKKTSVLEDAIAYAVSRGVIVLSAMGNSNVSFPQYPSGFSSVISIGALTPLLSRSQYANYGAHIDYATFGDSIYSTLPGGTYGVKSGTSQATAIASGVVSMILSLYPDMTFFSLSPLLQNTALDIGAVGHDSETGFGLLQVDPVLDNLSVVIPSVNRISIDDTREGLSRFLPLWILVAISVLIIL